MVIEGEQSLRIMVALSLGSDTSTGLSRPSILWPSFQSGPNMAEKGFEAALRNSE